MTTATPLGGNAVYSLNMTTRGEDFLYKSKISLAWRPGDRGRDRACPQFLVSRSRAWPLQTKCVGLDDAICQLHAPEHAISLLWALSLFQHLCCCCLVAESCLTLLGPRGPYSLLGSSVQGISQGRILQQVTISSPGNLPDPRIKPEPSALAGRFFTTEPPGKPSLSVQWED